MVKNNCCSIKVICTFLFIMFYYPKKSPVPEKLCVHEKKNNSVSVACGSK